MKDNIKEREQELRDEIKDFESERDNIRKIVGGIGGTPASKTRKINIIFAILVLTVFAMSLIWGGRVRFFMIELGILLLSIKLIFFLESFMKVNHFQFWILSSLEWRLDKIHKKLNEVSKELNPVNETSKKMNPEEFMARAIKEAYDGINDGDGGPFGAVIVKNGEIISSSHNTVLKSNDPTQHAEVNAISLASKKLGSFDLSGCDIYITTESCPMCFSAIHWARIDRIYYGTKIEDVARLGFNELTISASTMKEKGSSGIEIIGPILKEKCEELLKDWDNLPNKQVY